MVEEMKRRELVKGKNWPALLIDWLIDWLIVRGERWRSTMMSRKEFYVCESQALWNSSVRKTPWNINFTHRGTSIIIKYGGQLILGEATEAIRTLHWPFSQMSRLKIRFLYQLTREKAIKLSSKSSSWFLWAPTIHFSRGNIWARIISVTSWEFLKAHTWEH